LEQELSPIYVEIFAIGNELCYGRIYDTNSFWIAEQVTQLGAAVRRITCIPDNLSIICDSIREAVNRNPHFIIVTGGLGPTTDDLTIEALSRVFNLEIITSREILEIMAERRKVPVEQLAPNLVRMARSLKGAECLPNPMGWAPVTIIKSGDVTVFTLPGPPQEMKVCFMEHLAKRIKEKTGCESESRRVIVRMFESEVSPLTDEIMKAMPHTYLKPLVSEFQMDRGLPVDIVVFAENGEACRKKMEEAIKRLGELVAQKGGSLII
jgi:molybdenum cofactor synthesis domain-containing protein